MRMASVYEIRYGPEVGRAVIVCSLFWQILGLALLLASLWGLKIRSTGYLSILFWLALLLSYLLGVTLRIGILIDGDASVFTPERENLLFATALALAQFSYSMVVLLLHKLV